MPSTYAHYRMGKEVLDFFNTNDKEIAQVINSNKELFMIGLHGPDIFFYYKPYKSSAIKEIGTACHELSGSEFFTKMTEALNAMDIEDKTPYLAYLYGVICHYALDVSCHGSVFKKTADSGVAHVEIEGEFDRKLMVEDGLDPVRHSLTGHLVASDENARIISIFYDGAEPKDVKKGIKGMIFYSAIFLAPSSVKRAIIFRLLKIAGFYEEYGGFVINYEPNPLCADINEILSTEYKESIPLAEGMIREYTATGSITNPVLKYNFDGDLVEKYEI